MGHGTAGGIGVGDHPCPHCRWVVAVELRVDPPFGDEATGPRLDHVGRHRGPGKHPRRLAEVAHHAHPVVVEDEAVDGHRVVAGGVEEQETVELERLGNGRRCRGGHGRRRRRGGTPDSPLFSLGHGSSHRWSLRISAPSRGTATGSHGPGPADRGPTGRQRWRIASWSGRYPMSVTPASAIAWSRPRSATRSTWSATRASQSPVIARSSGVSIAGRSVTSVSPGSRPVTRSRKAWWVFRGGRVAYRSANRTPSAAASCRTGKPTLGSASAPST